MVDSQNAHKANPLNGSIGHPLVRLGLGDRIARSALRELTSALRTLSSAGLTAQEKLHCIESASLGASKLQTARSDQDSQLFRLDLLQVATAKDRSPVLWERLAETALAVAGLELKPGWESPELLSIPEVVSIEPRKFGKLVGAIPFQASQAWEKASAVMLSSASGRRQKLSYEEGMAALRCHVLLMCYGSNRADLCSAEQRLTTFLREGLGQWDRILQRLRSLNEGAAAELDKTWSAPLQRGVLMWLQHQAMTNSVTKPQGGREPSREGDIAKARADKIALRVIQGPIPPSASKEDAAALAVLEPLTASMPIKAMPSLAEIDAIIDSLRVEFPWAEHVVEQIGKLLRVRGLFGSPDLALPPILLAGSPGCGKSRLARRLAELLELPLHPIAIGGVTDAKPLLGTARGWGGACASPLLMPLLANKTASVLVLLDEIDKAGRNGDSRPALTSALLGFLEPETAARHHDVFLQTTCDFSRLVFVVTANSLEIPKALLSRFHVLYMPAPRQQDMPSLARGALIEMAKDLGIPEAFLPDPPAELIEQARGNARDMRRLLVGFLHEWACVHLHPARLN